MIGAIIQARMNSERFPGKVLHEIQGKPMLQYLLERVGRCRSLEAIVVATSQEKQDDPIANFCQSRGVHCYRGALMNVANRFKQVLERYPFDAFVRISGDSPLLDQRLIDKAVAIFQQGRFDMVTNILQRTYPRGQSVEVLNSAVFKSAYPLLTDMEAQEHVTKYFYSHKERFKIFNFKWERDCREINLAVDTQSDMDLVTQITKAMKREHWDYTVDEIVGIAAGCVAHREPGGT